MSGGFDVKLLDLRWPRRTPQTDSPVPAAAREVQRQADELHRIVLELRRINERKERNA